MANECPHCGKPNQWSYRQCFLSKDQKMLIEISYCSKCNWRFIERYKLYPVTHHGKLILEKEHKQSEWQKFATEGLIDGKTLKEIAKLWKEKKQ